MFEDVCNLLHLGHPRAGLTPEETLNRLFRKHLSGHKKDITANPPWLSAENTAVAMESWPKPALRELAPRVESRPPRFEDDPVVIVRYRGRDCLIDGGSRIHKWFEEGDTGEHPAYVVTVLGG